MKKAKKLLSLILVSILCLQYPIYTVSADTTINNIETNIEKGIEEQAPENVEIENVSVDITTQEVTVDASLDESSVNLDISLDPDTNYNQLTMTVNEDSADETYDVFFGSEEQKKLYDEALEKDNKLLSEIESTLSTEIINNTIELDDSDNIITETVEEQLTGNELEIDKLINNESFVISDVTTLENTPVILTNTQTNEDIVVESTDGVASWAFAIPIGIVLSKALISSLLYWGSAVVIGGVLGIALSKVSTDSRVRNKNYSHYKVVEWSGKLFSTGGISQKSAIARMAANGNVWPNTKPKAKTVASSASLLKKGKKTPIGPEKDKGKSGYYMHYHTNPRSKSKGHSFYGTPS